MGAAVCRDWIDFYWLSVFKSAKKIFSYSLKNQFKQVIKTRNNGSVIGH